MAFVAARPSSAAVPTYNINTLAGRVASVNGTQGLARAYRKPDLVIVDLMMPNLNGYEFLKQLRAIDGHASTPVIAASGLSTGEWALRAGADRFMAKPFQRRELIALVDSLLSTGGP